LCATAGARLSGASLIIAIDSVPRRLEMAKRMGADVVIDRTRRTPGRASSNLREGAWTWRGHRGQQATFESALRVIRPGGTVSSLGVYSGHLNLPLEAIAAGLADQTICTTLCPGCKERMRRLMSIVKAKRFPFRDLLTHSFRLDQIADAYELFARQGLRPQSRHSSVNDDPFTRLQRAHHGAENVEMSPHAGSAVWMDHHEARIFRVDAARVRESVVEAPDHHVHRHPADSMGKHEHPDDMRRFFGEIAGLLETAERILIVGPSTAKLHFMRYIRQHESRLERRIVGSDGPSTHCAYQALLRGDGPGFVRRRPDRRRHARATSVPCAYLRRASTAAEQADHPGVASATGRDRGFFDTTMARADPPAGAKYDL
jgi:hypothetical protein